MKKRGDRHRKSKFLIKFLTRDFNNITRIVKLGITQPTYISHVERDAKVFLNIVNNDFINN